MAVTQEKTKKIKEGGRVAATPPCQDRVGPSRTNSAHEEVQYSTQRALGRPRGRPVFAAIAERDTIDGRAPVKRRRVCWPPVKKERKPPRATQFHPSYRPG
eukprot:scaffold27383_cov48-Phaeocystis_antarctica.AAC.3